MPRRHLRLDERLLLAILLLAFGVVLPLLSAAASTDAASPLIATAAPFDSVQGQRQAATAERQTNGERLPTAIEPQLVAVSHAPTIGLPATAAHAVPPVEPTQTDTPQALAPTSGPADGAARPVPTLFPTLVAPAEAGAPQAGDAAAPGVVGGPPPIIMYHYVRIVDQASDPLGYDLSIAPDLFESQMAWLHEQGYRTMRMDAAARCINSGVCPAKAVALTFDDGYEDAFTTAWPVLQRYGFTATFYIISGFVGQPGYMNWEQLAALRDAGMEIGAHTVDHSDLTTLDPADSEREIIQSKNDLEQHLGIGIVSFCYPTGLYNWTIEDQTRAAGYLSATTTRWDNDYSDLMALPRRRVSGGMSVEEFAGLAQ